MECQIDYISFSPLNLISNAELTFRQKSLSPFFSAFFASFWRVPEERRHLGSNLHLMYTMDHDSIWIRNGLALRCSQGARLSEVLVVSYRRYEEKISAQIITRKNY